MVFETFYNTPSYLLFTSLNKKTDAELNDVLTQEHIPKIFKQK